MSDASNFVRDIIDEDLRTGKYGNRVVTRFPPEPNGYLHIGHAKSICLNFGLARDYEGVCHLRFDDTNPESEDEEYARSIQRDVQWLGFEWGDNLYYASDYYEQLYDYAVALIKAGKAYVCSLSEEDVREYRGSLTEPGKHSPYRDRTVDENLDLFQRMRSGEFPEGAHIVRAKIDMASPNMKMRDPPIYRIKHTPHYRQADKWCIYPLYDFTHCLSDYIEKITHSICTLEFENNRELYDWVLDELNLTDRPYQYEFARLNLSYTVMSKRKLLRLVRENHVNGWDDPRMPTIAGLRRRGVTSEALRAFCDRIGVAKNNSIVDLALFEHTLRDDLNAKAPRVLCVLDPIRVVIENYPENAEEWIDANSFPSDVGKPGSRKVPFSKTLFIERKDFEEDPPPKYHRLAPGREVRLRNAYFLKCNEVIKDAEGNVTELRCTYDPETKGGKAPDGRKVKGTIHWVSAQHALGCEVRVYERLFNVENPNEGDFVEHLNPESLTVYKNSQIEPSVLGTTEGDRYQFERQGYFAVDPDSTDQRLLFNCIVSLKDSWAKVAAPEKVAAVAAPAKSKSKKASTRPSTKKEASAPARDPLSEPEIQAFAQTATSVCGDAKLVNNWIKNELLRELKERPLTELKLTAQTFGELLKMLGQGALSTGAAKQVFAELVLNGGSPADIVAQKGLQQMDDADALAAIVEQVMASNPSEAERFASGDMKLMGFFMGQVMKASRGKADPKQATALLRKYIS